MTFEELYLKLPKEIVIDDNGTHKHYGLSITPWDIAYTALDSSWQVKLFKVIAIKDKTDDVSALLPVMEEMLSWCKENKYVDE